MTDMTRDDIRAMILALAAMDKIGPLKIKLILAQADNPADVLNWDTERFEALPGIGHDLAERLATRLDIDHGRKLIEWAEEKNFGLVTLIDDDYPESLRALYDPPPFLFYRGNVRERDNRAVAMVGSRGATDYGRAAATKISGDLAHAEITVVSGLAIGIDSVSHRGALEAGGRTIAVLGSGIDRIYPRENTWLADQIAESGSVVSEFFPGTDPSPGNFPRRNRIIAGLSQAVVVIEAGEKSGALLTADLALTQDKALFAVPGNVTSRMSAGTNDLLKSGAKLLTSIDDIFSVLPRLKNDYIGPRQRVVTDLTDGEQLVFDRLSQAPVHLDHLVRDCRLPVGDVTSYLLSLELRGLVKQLAGKRFIVV